VRVDQIREFKQFETPQSTPMVANAGKPLQTAAIIPSASVK